jgi:hypothetical protein
VAWQHAGVQKLVAGIENPWISNIQRRLKMAKVELRARAKTTPCFHGSAAVVAGRGRMT